MSSVSRAYSGFPQEVLQVITELKGNRGMSHIRQAPIYADIDSYLHEHMGVVHICVCRHVMAVMAIVHNLGDGVLFKGLVLAEPGIP